MPFASAYPSSSLSAVQFVMLVIVVFGGLAVWLGFVYLCPGLHQHDLAVGD